MDATLILFFLQQTLISHFHVQNSLIDSGSLSHNVGRVASPPPQKKSAVCSEKLSFIFRWGVGELRKRWNRRL